MQSKTLLICLVVTYSCILSINALVAGGNNMWNGDAPTLKKEVKYLYLIFLCLLHLPNKKVKSNLRTTLDLWLEIKSSPVSKFVCRKQKTTNNSPFIQF